MPVLPVIAPNVNPTGPTLPSVAAPAMPVLPGAGALPQVNVPQIAPPVMPPAVLLFLFKEQQPFVGIGLDIASGKTPVP